MCVIGKWDVYRDQGILGFYHASNNTECHANVRVRHKQGVRGRFGRVEAQLTAFRSSFLAGFFMTVTVAPFDRILTNLMNHPTYERVYEGGKTEGPLSL